MEWFIRLNFAVEKRRFSFKKNRISIQPNLNIFLKVEIFKQFLITFFLILNPYPSKLLLSRLDISAMNGYRDGLERKEVSMPRANQKREDVMDKIADPG